MLKPVSVIVLGAFLLVEGLAQAAWLPVNLAPSGTATAQVVTNNTPPVLQDENPMTQLDMTQWAAITWPTPQTFNKLIFEQCPGYVVKGFDLQVAKAGVTSPNGVNDGDWETLPGGSFSGMANNSQPSYAFNLSYTRSGVRFKATDVSNIGDARARPRELWVFNGTANLGLTATSVSAPGWTDLASPVSGKTRINDEILVDQAYTSNVATYPTVTFTWATPQPIAGVILQGGTGAANEHLIDYKFQYFQAGIWVDALSVTGNTQKLVRHEWLPVVSDQFRLFITKADNQDGYARVSEIMIFAPEPASFLLLALACAAVPRRRR